MRAALAFVVVGGAMLVACSDPDPSGAVPPASAVTSIPTTNTVPSTGAPSEIVASNGPFDPDAAMSPDLMVIDPAVVGPGEEVMVTYPGGRDRGVAYVLERSREGKWYTTHFMIAANDSPDRVGREPAWADSGTLGFGWESIGISGPGPDRLVIPPPALAGDSRICTANSVENICAEVTVVKPDEPRASVGPVAPLSAVGGSMYATGSALIADHVGLPLAEFELRVAAEGYRPVRVAWQDGDYLAVTDDLVVGRVNVAVETRDGTQVVIDAFVENDPETGAATPEATVVDVIDDVSFYPACGNEQLELDGVVWYQVQQAEYPEIYDRAVTGYRENTPEGIGPQGFAPHGFAPRVGAPGPGDDIGTLVVWSDDVAYFVSDSGDLSAWLVREELTYRWEC